MAKRIAVVGAGVIGLCVAAEIAERGHQVVVYDRQPEGADQCSTGNAGMIVPSHVIPLAAPGMVGLGLRMMLNPRGPFRIRPRLNLDQIRWMWRFMRLANQANVDRAGPALRDLSLLSRRRYIELSTETDFGLVQKGLLMVCQRQTTLDAEAHAVSYARELGLVADLVGADDLAKLDPDVRYAAAGAAYFPQDCHLDPVRFLGALRTRIRTAGGEIRYNSPAPELSELEADEVVLAAGVWSGDLAREIGLQLPLMAGKGYSVTLNQPAMLPTICSILVEGRVAVTPMGQQLRVGGTMELGGREGIIDAHRVSGIAEAFCRFVPDFSLGAFDGLPVWHGLRPCAPDGLPYIGRTRSLERVIIATGHAMMGVSLAPATGRVVADLVDQVEPEVNLSAFDPDRFSR